jgi:hypothetical protein
MEVLNAFRSGVSKPQPAAAFVKLLRHYKNYKIILAGSSTTYCFLSTAARETAENDGCGRLP